MTQTDNPHPHPSSCPPTSTHNIQALEASLQGANEELMTLHAQHEASMEGANQRLLALQETASKVC